MKAEFTAIASTKAGVGTVCTDRMRFQTLSNEISLEDGEEYRVTIEKVKH